MELRRALLLFAIVLGLAAVVTSLSRTGSSKRAETAPAVSPTQTARPAPGPSEPADLRFDASRAPLTRRLETSRHATVTVRVPEPGTVELEGLGLTASGEPGTPARFDVLPSRPGRHTVRFIPPDGTSGRTVGSLVVRGPR